MENDFISFHARFGGVSREIVVPVENVAAIYARENGQGMAFEVGKASPVDDAESSLEPSGENGNKPPADYASGLTAVPEARKDEGSATDQPPEPPKKGPRPTLTRIK
jgi:stringent starvation protein B